MLSIMMLNISLLKKNFLCLIVTMLNITLWGCSNSKMSSCNLLKEVTTELQETAINYWDSEDINEIQQVANKFKEAEEKILASKIRDENLLESSQKLANIYAQYSQITSTYISAYQNKEGEKMNKYQKEINQLFKNQATIIQDINGYCSN
jgi:hypothetical protein